MWPVLLHPTVRRFFGRPFVDCRRGGLPVVPLSRSRGVSVRGVKTVGGVVDLSPGVEVCA